MLAAPSGPINWFGRDFSDEEFVQAMVDQERLVYEFEVHRSYGLGWLDLTATSNTTPAF